MERATELPHFSLFRLASQDLGFHLLSHLREKMGRNDYSKRSFSKDRVQGDGFVAKHVSSTAGCLLSCPAPHNPPALLAQGGRGDLMVLKHEPVGS